MSKYTPETPPQALQKELQEYLWREILRIASTFDLNDEEIAAALALADSNLTAAIATLNAAIALKASITYVDSENAAQDASLFGSVKTTVFTASGTFTSDAKMLYCEVTAWGGGGGGAGAPTTGAGQMSAGGNGNGGAKAILITDKATIGASQTVTIGGGGAGGAAGANNGATGGDTTLGSLLSAQGAEGGTSVAAGTAANPVGPATSQSATGTIRGWTHRGSQNAFATTSPFSNLGYGGTNELGGDVVCTINNPGVSANANTGAGGGGIILSASQAARAGGNGGSGLMLVKEYLSL